MKMWNIQHRIVFTNMGRITSFLGMTLASLYLSCAPVLAQTSVIATPLPQPKSTFLDANGHPVVGAQIFHYVPNTTTKKTTWSDTGETNPNTNPVVTDAAGRATIFGQGNYDQKFVLPNGIVQWSSFTTAVGSAQPAGSTGTDTAPVGSLMPFSGFSVPTNWQLAYGQALSRTSFPDLLVALTIASPSVSCTSSSTSLSGWTSTSAMAVGQPVEASCIPTGATIASITNSTTIVISAAATASATVAAKVFPWGNGDGSLTFNVPDMRGRVAVGPDCQGGTCASRLSSTYYGALANAPAVSGGSQSGTLAQTNLPAVNFVNSGITANFNSASILLPIHSSTISSSNGSQAAQGVQGPEADLAADSGTIAVNITAQGSAASGGSSTPISRIQPSLTTNYIVKVMPNASGAGGVVSVGGMFGDIVCGPSFICTPIASVNTIECANAVLGQTGCIKPDGVTTSVSGDGTLSSINLLTAPYSFLGNPTGSTAPWESFTIGSLSSQPSPSSTALFVIQDSITGVINKTSLAQAFSGVSPGVISFNGLTGAVTFDAIISVTTSKSIVTSDCGTVQVLSGGAFPNTLTFPAASGMPVNCQIQVTNKDISPPVGKRISIPGYDDYVLYPTQTFTVTNNGGSWLYSQRPSRWQTASGGTIDWYANYSAGSDAPAAVDGLDLTRPFKSAQSAIQTAYVTIDCNTLNSENTQRINLAANTADELGMHIPFHESVGCQGGSTFTITGATAPVLGTANNGSGLIRLTLGSTSGYFTNQPECVYAVQGTIEANRCWLVTVVDATHLDLQGSAFVNAFINSGTPTITVGSSFNVAGTGIGTYFMAGLVIENLNFYGLKAIEAQHRSDVYLGPGNIFSTTGPAITVSGNSYVEAQNEYGINTAGSSAYHVITGAGGQYVAYGAVDFIIPSATILFNTFALATTNSGITFNEPINLNGNTVQGTRCNASLNGVVTSGTGMPNTAFPGNVNCSTSTGGQIN